MYSKKNEKKIWQYLFQIFKGNDILKEKKRSTKNVAMKEKKAIQKVIKETRKNKYKSQTKQCDDIHNRQKRNCKNIHAQRKIGRKLKSKKN